MNGSTVVGWDHDFSRQGVGRTDVIGVAEVELVVWDDEPLSRDGLEFIILTVNGIALPGLDIVGSAEAPYHHVFKIPWLECRDGFDGILEMRLTTVPVGNEPAGDMFFGSATTRLHVGQFERNVLDNGDFECKAYGWTCDGAPCDSTDECVTGVVEASTWSALKQRYR